MEMKELDKEIEDAVLYGYGEDRVREIMGIDEFPHRDLLFDYPEEEDELYEIYRAFILYVYEYRNIHPDEDTLHIWSEEAIAEVEYGMQIYRNKRGKYPASDIFMVFRWMAEHLKEYLEVKE